MEKERLEKIINSKAGAIVVSNIDKIMQKIHNGTAFEESFILWNSDDDYGIEITLKFIGTKLNSDVRD